MARERRFLDLQLSTCTGVAFPREVERRKKCFFGDARHWTKAQMNAVDLNVPVEFGFFCRHFQDALGYG